MIRQHGNVKSVRIVHYHVSDAIVEQAIHLRQQRKMSLGDAVIGATALTHNLKLATANVKDFAWIKNLEVINPV